MEKLICGGAGEGRGLRGHRAPAGGPQARLALRPAHVLVPAELRTTELGSATCAAGKELAPWDPPAPTQRARGRAGGTHRSPCGRCGYAAAGPGAAVSARQRSPGGCCGAGGGVSLGPRGAGRWEGYGEGHSRGHQGLVLLVEEAEVLGAAGLVGRRWRECPRCWALDPSGDRAVTARRDRDRTKATWLAGLPGVGCDRVFASWYQRVAAHPRPGRAQKELALVAGSAPGGQSWSMSARSSATH